MSSIAKHHTEKKWKGHNGVQSWIGFTVRGNTISVDQILKTSGELVCSVERRWIFFCVNDVQKRRNRVTAQTLKVSIYELIFERITYLLQC